MSKNSMPSDDTILADSVAPSPANAALKNTATVFNPAQVPSSESPEQASSTTQAYHHKANHNQNRSIEQSSSSAQAHASSPVTAPKIGFVSLGCPKALVDSERISLS